MATEQIESKRGRVRRLLIDPLEELGLRHKKGVTIEDQKKINASLADGLAYMSDRSLEVLFSMLKSKGQGRNMDLWPSKVTIISLAELVEPRPVEELPELLRWFRSVAGPKARDAGILVETWVYFNRMKKPPFGAERQLRSDAEKNRHDMEMIRDRQRRACASPEDSERLKRYEARLEYCLNLVREGEATRTESEAV